MRLALLAGLVATLFASGCGGQVPGRPTPAPDAAADTIPLGALPRQALAKGECGLFLWIAARPPRLVFMAKSAAPPFARIMLDGHPIDLPRIGEGDAAFAGSPNALYGNGNVTATIEVTLEARRGLRAGGVVNGGSLRIERTNADGFVVPVSGMLACG